MTGNMSVGQQVKIVKPSSEFNGQIGKIVKIKPAIDSKGQRYAVSFEGDDEVTFVFHIDDLANPPIASTSTKKKNR